MPPIYRTPADYTAADAAPRDTPTYTAGYQAGRWRAEALASFTDLEQLEAEALTPPPAVGPFLRGFADGALAAWERMIAAPVGLA